MESKKSINLNIIDKEKSIFSGNVLSINIKTADGYRTILPDHQPMVSIVIANSTITIKKLDDSQFTLTPSDGIIEVQRRKVRILLKDLKK